MRVCPALLCAFSGREKNKRRRGGLRPDLIQVVAYIFMRLINTVKKRAAKVRPLQQLSSTLPSWIIVVSSDNNHGGENEQAGKVRVAMGCLWPQLMEKGGYN
jgi:hypothetical protein